MKEISLFRHFRGGYYVVHSIAKEEATQEDVVVYQSLQDGRVWIRPLSDFNAVIPEDKENPTGQMHRFEAVNDFHNQISLISTENLLKELQSRQDCPPEVLSSISQSDDHSRIWSIDYVVGRPISEIVDNHEEVFSFAIDSVFENEEDAKNRLEFIGNPSFHYLKRIFLKQDFD